MRVLAAAAFASFLFVGAAWAQQEAGDPLALRGVEVKAKDLTPSVCVSFDRDVTASTEIDYTQYVEAKPEAKLSTRVDSGALCMSGFDFGRKYDVTLRKGLPSDTAEAGGAQLAEDAVRTVEIPDRNPFVMFRESGNVLPRFDGLKTELGLPLRTVNVKTLAVKVMRIGDRGLASAMHDGNWKDALAGYNVESFSTNGAETVWQGKLDVKPGEKNKESVTAFPISALPQPLRPGIYVAVAWNDAGKKAAAEDSEDADYGYDESYYESRATQWFTVSDIGLTTFTGSDGLTVFARGLSDAKPMAGLQLQLLAADNDVLGIARTDSSGKAVFAPGLMRGKGGARPGLLQAFANGQDGDFAFLELEGTAIDLSDRGVSGRATPGPLDPFVFTERGIYRPGERIAATVLLRDEAARLTPALADLPLTVLLVRPDGVEAQRQAVKISADGSAQVRFDLPENAYTGSWQLSLLRDPNDAASAIGTHMVQVEDFIPPRLEMTLTPSVAALTVDDNSPAPDDSDDDIDESADGSGSGPTLSVQTDYLYGAPASGLPGEIALTIRPAATPFADFADYSFGRVEEEELPIRLDPEPFQLDEQGHADLPLALDAVPDGTRPMEVQATVSVFDVSGRPLMRSVTMPLQHQSVVLGLKPGNAGAFWQKNQEADFDLVALDATGKRVASKGVKWTLNKEDVNYNWFSRDGRWQYETTTTDEVISSGLVDIAADKPTALKALPQYGQYRLDVDDPTGASSSYRFYAGWWGGSSPGSQEKPDRVEVKTDKPSYAAGETAKVFVKPPVAGPVLLVVAEKGIVSTRLLDVPAAGSTVDVPVSGDWAAGAYVMATAYTEAGAQDRLLPRRAVGVAWLQLDKAQRDLPVAIDAVEATPSATVLPVTLHIGGASAPAAGAKVVLAAVDDGILQITGYTPPDPLGYYMAQRSLDLQMRDFYGRLIDPSNAAMGEARSGGDGDLGDQLTNLPKKQEKLVAFMSPVLDVPADGTVKVNVDLPRFAGRVRLMAVTWNGARFGHADKTAIVRDPFSGYVAMPRFLAPGDMAEAVVQMEMGDAKPGTYTATVTSSSDAVTVDSGSLSFPGLTANATARQSVILHGNTLGDSTVTLALTAPDGTKWSRDWTLSTRAASPAIVKRDSGTVAPGASLQVSGDLAANMIPGSATVSYSVSNLPDLNLPQVLKSLDRYPYGCVEQTTSRAMPLLYVNDVEQLLGKTTDDALPVRINRAVDRVLGMQNSTGAFGMWGPSEQDAGRWLSAYATEFLVRAKEKGYHVPAAALNKSIAYLRGMSNPGAYTESDRFEEAYVLYVLARAGSGMLAETRYFQETYGAKLPTEIARAQLGYAFALMGDTARADAVFKTIGTQDRLSLVGLHDYGTPVRDRAAALALMAESGRVPADRLLKLADGLRDLPDQRYMSTQENAWLVMAASSVGKLTGPVSLSVDGKPQAATGTFARVLEPGAKAGLKNTGTKPLFRTVSVSGVPTAPEPGEEAGIHVERKVFQTNGEPADLAHLKQHDTVVVVLEGKLVDNDGSPRQLLLADLLPAGLELENTRLADSSDLRDLAWLGDLSHPTHTEFRDDRYVATFDSNSVDDNGETSDSFRTAYIARAVTPGRFVMPGVQVEDMYDPQVHGRTDASRMAVTAAAR